MFISPRLSLRKAISGRKAQIGLGLALTALFLPSVAARAGSWSGPDYTFTGTTTDRDGNTSSWTWGPDAYFYEPWFYSGVSFWGGDSTSATVKTTFTWNPDPSNPNDTPTPLYVRETASVLAGSGDDRTSSAHDGIGDAPLIYDNMADSHGSHLVNEGKDSPVTITRTLSAQCYMGVLQMQYQADQDSRILTISSGIEDSYYKGGADPERMSYSHKNERQPDGSISVDCAVVPNTGITGGGGYHADVTLTANPVGFLNLSPYYHWNTDGGSVSEMDSGLNQTISPHYDFNAGASSAATLGASSKIKVSVTDDDGAKAESNYTIRWHYPVENWAASDKATEIAPTIYGSADGTQPANGQVNVSITGKGKVDISTGEKAVGGVLTTATAVFVGEVDPLLLGLAGAAGYTLSLSSPPDVTVYTLHGSFGQLQSDVGTESAIASGNTAGIFMPNTARMDSALAATISASGDYAGYFRGDYGTMSFTGLIGQHRLTKTYEGDAYDGHGYSGPAVGTVNYPGALEYVYTWALAGGPSGHS